MVRGDLENNAYTVGWGENNTKPRPHHSNPGTSVRIVFRKEPNFSIHAKGTYYLSTDHSLDVSFTWLTLCCFRPHCVGASDVQGLAGALLEDGGQYDGTI